jgi:bifunctional pyridoxal-dependent enzyme with beta-cystathionase and maltose regulon repressor activities
MPDVTVTFASDQQYTFPRDPAGRLFTIDELYKLAAISLYNAGTITDDGIAHDAILDTLQTSFDNETVVPVISVS